MIAVSFFSGAGGLDIGIHKAGFDVRLCVEIEPKYCETLALNNPTWNVKCGDIMQYNRQRVYEEAGLGENEVIDLVIGGSPCQSFSTAGLRQAFDDPRGRAMLKYAELIEELQPKVFLLENVRGLLSAALKHRKIEHRGKGYTPLTDEELPGSALKYLLTKFTSYDVQYKLVNAANYGVPQKRERVFIIGIRKDLRLKFEYPKETHSKNGGKGKKKWVTVAEVFDKLKSVEKHNFVSYSEERLKYMQMIPIGGGNWRDLPKEIAMEAMGGAYHSGGGKVGFFRRIKVDEPAPTLLTSPHQKSTNLGHPFEDRPLSIEEYLEIQGFPQGYKVSGTLTDQYTQIGNAVPVELAFVIGKSIKKVLGKK
jgi:DNA (cytosine-5)-methyltransferase 1